MVNGFMGWRGGRAGMINDSLLYGPPVLFCPGWTTGGVTGGVCSKNIASVWVEQLKQVLGFLMYYTEHTNN